MSPPQEEMEQTTSCKQAIPPSTTTTATATATALLLLLFNVFIVLLGIGGPLLLRLYFIHGGSRLWLSSFVQNAGFPILLAPIFLYSFINNCRPFQLPSSVFVIAAFVGLLFGLDGYLYGFASSYLPVSTTTILMASQLSFTAVFAFLINRQCYTAYSINAVVLLTIGPVILGMSSSKDRPVGVSNGKYILGYVMSLLAASLLGLTLPVMERLYKMVKEVVTYGMVMEIQLVIGISASVFCLVGMAANKDFQAIAREARDFELGEVKYYFVLICLAILFQLSNLGIFGVICCSSSLFGGILYAATLPVLEILAVIFFHEKFNGSKGIALTLSLWGFTSYLYGEWRQSRKLKKEEVQIPLDMP